MVRNGSLQNVMQQV